MQKNYSKTTPTKEKPMNRTLAISDIHGCLDEFKSLLKKVNYIQNDQLILLGDYMDRGSNSLGVLQLVMKLVKENKAIAIRGNHDQMFLDWLSSPEDEKKYNFLYRNGGKETIESFVGDLSSIEAAEKIKKEYLEEVVFLETLPYYHETDTHIFIHAGINPTHTDWKETSNHEMIWIREPFYDFDHPHEKTVVFGHTPCKNLHEKHDICYRNKRIGIDGGCVYGGQLNCFIVEDEQFVFVSYNGEVFPE